MRSPIYNFVRNMWVLGRADESFVDLQVTRNRLTEEEAIKIKKLSVN